ncbi:hypothetical protein OUZ56_020111 [Daphnia magna]|uniref:AraC family transcriptional regulator n=1 Tax=Daphnia magna TaxID=35525 RepID=A0ABQ9ZDJ9_9CRUS|nr:hypothetical protein OUZ56_020111 [Daphnia magna]
MIVSDYIGLNREEDIIKVSTTLNTPTSFQYFTRKYRKRSSMAVSRYYRSSYTHDLLHAQKPASLLVIVD